MYDQNSITPQNYNYKLLYERSPLGYQSLDEQGCFIIVNPAWLELFGYDVEEVIGQWFGDFVTESSRERLKQNFSHFKSTGKICGIEFQMLRKDGSMVDVTLDGRIGYDEQGNFKQTHCILHEVSNKSLEASYRNIFESSLNEIYIFDAETFRFQQVNRGACHNIGYSCEELYQLTPLSIQPEMTAESFSRLIEPVQSGAKEIVRFETVHRRKNGSSYAVEVHLQLSTFLLKPVFVAIILDITQRKEIENRLNLVIKGADLGYWDWDYVTGYHLVNDRWLDMLGLEREDLDDYVGDWSNRLHSEDRTRVHATVQQSIDTKQPYAVEFRMKHKQGHWVWIQGSGSVVAYDVDNKSPLRLCGTHQDISLRKRNEEKVRQLSRAVEQSPSLVIITDLDGCIEYVNPKIYETTGYTAGEVLGKNISVFHKCDTGMDVYRQLWETVKSGKEWRGSLHNCKKNGELHWVQQSIAPIKDEYDNITHFVAIQVDVTEAKKASEQLNYHATHDPLTGLINRREFENRLKRSLDVVKQIDAQYVLCYLDLDQFKVINDTCTHVAGDELLKQFAFLLSGTFRSRDTIGRLGGDEFAVLLEHCSAKQAEKIAWKLLEEISHFQFLWGNKRFRVGVSIGITGIGSMSGEISTLMSQADIACYNAKNAGRNCIHVYQENDLDQSLGHKQLHWISRLNEALNEDHFLIYVQPIFSTQYQDGVPEYFEVLIRLRDSNGDIVPPGAFLPAVERFNLAFQLDQWVIEAVFKRLARMSEYRCELPCLSINLFGNNLGNKRLLAFIGEKRAAYNIPAEKICFEITETAAINNLSDAKIFITELTACGFKFSLDDFGSGLSSFDYLRNLPVDFLKIDGQFIRNIEHDEIDYALVKSINEIGHVMGKRTIAEFVENDRIAQTLKGLKVDYLQGFHLGEPMLLEHWT